MAAPTLSGLGTNFGLWPLLGKTVAMVQDARLSGRTDSAAVAERLLSISGEDALTVDRKNLSPVTTRLTARFMLLTNELPWPKLFHNLRASRETELAAAHPLHVVCARIGNTERIANKHYLQVTDEDFAKAASPNSAKYSAPNPETAQDTAQHRAAPSTHGSRETPEITGFSSCSSGYTCAEEYARRDSNPQPMVPKAIRNIFSCVRLRFSAVFCGV